MSSNTRSARRPLPAYGRTVYNRRLASDDPSLLVIATDFRAGLHWDGKPQVSRVVCPLDKHPEAMDWLIAIDIDVAICPAPGTPGHYTDRLIHAVSAQEPRMIFLEIAPGYFHHLIKSPFSAMRISDEPIPAHELGRYVRTKERDLERVQRLLARCAGTEATGIIQETIQSWWD